MAVTAIARVANGGVFVSMVATGGDANKWLTRKLRQARSIARARAPVGPPRVGDPTHGGPGTLKRRTGMTGVIWQGRGIRSVGSLYADTPYAIYVHEGVPGKIFPKSGKFRIPKTSWDRYTGGAGGADGKIRKGTHVFWRNPVKGQSRNPFLTRALATTLGQRVYMGTLGR